MSEAWQVRECQRQQLIEKLVRGVHDWADELCDPSFYLEVVAVMIGYLQDRQKGISNPEVDGKKAPGSFFNTVLPNITKFSRTEAEGDVLVATFLEKVLASGLSPFRAELQKEELFSPEKIFKAPSAMVEVPEEEAAADLCPHSEKGQKLAD